jgi:hypothetical protein
MDKQHDPLKDHNQDTVDRAARAAGTTRERAKQTLSPQEQQNLSQRQRSPEKLANFYNESSDSTPIQQDGYQETGGSGSDEPGKRVGEPAQRNPAQQGYDPGHSGPHTSKRRPGTEAPSPGRETGTAWAENEQMGSTTDTPDRRNPAQ